MPYVALDLETTGLNVDHHQILEIGAVLNNPARPVIACSVFRRTTEPEGNIVGSPYALALNASLLRQIADGDCESLTSACHGLRDWLFNPGIHHKNKATLIGKNIGSFDWQFLRRLGAFPAALFNYRMLDVGSMYSTPEGISGQASLCAATAKQHKIPGVEHTAIFDARVSLALARDKWAFDAAARVLLPVGSGIAPAAAMEPYTREIVVDQAEEITGP